MRYLLICALLTLAQIPAGPATAADVILQPLASITNDRNAHVQNLSVLVEAGQVVGLRFDTINGNNPHASDFSLDDMRVGAVLEDATHKAIVLRGAVDSTAGNADLIVTYLSNALFGTHRDCRVRLVRDDSGQWHIVNIYNHNQVDHLFVQTWMLGISRIAGICPR